MLLLYFFLRLFFTVSGVDIPLEKIEYDDRIQKLMSKTSSYLVNTEIYSDYLICAKHRNRDGTFEFEKCNSYPAAGFVPFCIYMISPSNETERGYDKYGCIYAHNLPQECFDNKEYYFEHVALPFRDREHSGAAYCCQDNYCNELEEPLFASIRMKKKSTFGTDDAVSIIIAILIILTTVLTYINGRLQKRHSRHRRVLDAPIRAVDKWVGSFFPRVQEVLDVHHQSMKFASLKKMRHVAKDVLVIYRHGHFGSRTRTSDSGSGSGNTPDDSASPTLHAPVEESHFNTPVELVIHPVCMVFEKSLDWPRKVMRSIPTKFEYLAQKLIEHGPYHYNFDVVELAEMFDSVVPLLAAEPSLLDLPEETYIYGNIEGSYGDLFRWFHRNGWPPNTRVLFLGGLTNDRQEFSLETMALIFAMKRLMPQHVYIIRGAAETRPLKMDGRFTRRITRTLQNVILRMCGHLPLAATIGSVFFSHGGFPETTDEVKQIRLAHRPMFIIPEGSIANKLIFSQVGPNEFAPPGSRGSWISGEGTVLDALVPSNGQTFSLFVRSRNYCPQGYMFIGEQILSLWSAAGIPHQNKAGASLYVDREMNVHLTKMTRSLFTRKELKKREENKKRLEQEKKKKRHDEKKRKAEEARKHRDEERRQMRDVMMKSGLVKKKGKGKQSAEKMPKENPGKEKKKPAKTVSATSTPTTTPTPK